MTLLQELAPYFVLVLVGFLPNEVWRWLGVAFARGLDENSELLVWVRAVATAVLTGVVAKLVVFSPGALATVPLAVRLGSAAAGLAAFFILRQSVFAGLAVGAAGIVIGAIAFAG
jgi:hypothetical protein